MPLNTQALEIDLMQEFVQQNGPVVTIDQLKKYRPPINEDIWDGIVNGPPSYLLHLLQKAGVTKVTGFTLLPLQKLTHTQHVDDVITVKVKVLAVSEVEPYPTFLFYRCKTCNNLQQVENTPVGGPAAGIVQPACDCAHPKLELQAPVQFYNDRQIVKAQDAHGVKINLVFSGPQNMHRVKVMDSVTATGVYRITPLAKQTLTTTTTTTTNHYHYNQPQRHYYRWLQVYYYDVEHAAAPVAITQQDIAQFTGYDKNKLWQILQNSFAPHIVGYPDVKTALILLLSSTDLDEPLNCLLAGDPSTAKSAFLTYCAMLDANGHYISLAGARWPALSVHAQRDEETGSYIIVPGLFARADRGLACCDEMQGAEEEVIKKLNEAGSRKWLSYAKGGQFDSVPARCAWLFATNAKFGSWRGDHTLSQNLEFLGKSRDTLITRFTLIFIFRDLDNEEIDEKIARQIIANTNYKLQQQQHGPDVEYEHEKQQQNKEQQEQQQQQQQEKFGFITLKKYFAYIKTLPLPPIPPGLDEQIVQWYKGQRKRTDDNRHFIKPRFLVNALKLAQIRARLVQKTTTDIEDFYAITKLLEATMAQAAFDPATKKVDADALEGSRPKSEHEKELNKEEKIMHIFENNREVSYDEWLTYLTTINFSIERAEAAIAAMEKAGKVIIKLGGKYTRLQ